MLLLKRGLGPQRSRAPLASRLAVARWVQDESSRRVKEAPLRKGCAPSPAGLGEHGASGPNRHNQHKAKSTDEHRGLGQSLETANHFLGVQPSDHHRRVPPGLYTPKLSRVA